MKFDSFFRRFFWGGAEQRVCDQLHEQNGSKERETASRAAKTTTRRKERKREKSTAPPKKHKMASVKKECECGGKVLPHKHCCSSGEKKTGTKKKKAGEGKGRRVKTLVGGGNSDHVTCDRTKARQPTKEGTAGIPSTPLPRIRKQSQASGGDGETSRARTRRFVVPALALFLFRLCGFRPPFFYPFGHHSFGFSPCLRYPPPPLYDMTSTASPLPPLHPSSAILPCPLSLPLPPTHTLPALSP